MVSFALMCFLEALRRWYMRLKEIWRRGVVSAFFISCNVLASGTNLSLRIEICAG